MKDIKMVISRNYQEKQTSGKGFLLYGDEVLMELCTLELPLYTPALKTNVPRTNCIPEGTYDVHKVYSPSQGNCFEVEKVEGRSHILIHKGNYATGAKVDTQGCILVGSSFEDINKDGQVDVKESGITLLKMLHMLPNEFKLHII